MSRGPGRTQRVILDVLAKHATDDAAHTAFRKEWGCATGELPTWFIAVAVNGRGADLRQIRRALESLERRGLVTKRLVNHDDYKGGGVRAQWRLAAASE